MRMSSYSKLFAVFFCIMVLDGRLAFSELIPSQEQTVQQPGVAVTPAASGTSETQASTEQSSTDSTTNFYGSSSLSESQPGETEQSTEEQAVLNAALVRLGAVDRPLPSDYSEPVIEKLEEGKFTVSTTHQTATPPVTILMNIEKDLASDAFYVARERIYDNIDGGLRQRNDHQFDPSGNIQAYEYRYYDDNGFMHTKVIGVNPSDGVGNPKRTEYHYLQSEPGYPVLESTDTTVSYPNYAMMSQTYETYSNGVLAQSVTTHYNPYSAHNDVPFVSKKTSIRYHANGKEAEKIIANYSTTLMTDTADGREYYHVLKETRNVYNDMGQRTAYAITTFLYHANGKVSEQITTEYSPRAVTNPTTGKKYYPVLVKSRSVYSDKGERTLYTKETFRYHANGKVAHQVITQYSTTVMMDVSGDLYYPAREQTANVYNEEGKKVEYSKARFNEEGYRESFSGVWYKDGVKTGKFSAIYTEDGKQMLRWTSEQFHPGTTVKKYLDIDYHDRMPPEHTHQEFGTDGVQIGSTTTSEAPGPVNVENLRGIGPVSGETGPIPAAVKNAALTLMGYGNPLPIDFSEPVIKKVEDGKFIVSTTFQTATPPATYLMNINKDPASDAFYVARQRIYDKTDLGLRQRVDSQLSPSGKVVAFEYRFYDGKGFMHEKRIVVYLSDGVTDSKATEYHYIQSASGQPVLESTDTTVYYFNHALKSQTHESYSNGVLAHSVTTDYNPSNPHNDVPVAAKEVSTKYLSNGKVSERITTEFSTTAMTDVTGQKYYPALVKYRSVYNSNGERLEYSVKRFNAQGYPKSFTGIGYRDGAISGRFAAGYSEDGKLMLSWISRQYHPGTAVLQYYNRDAYPDRKHYFVEYDKDGKRIAAKTTEAPEPPNVEDQRLIRPVQ